MLIWSFVLWTVQEWNCSVSVFYLLDFTGCLSLFSSPTFNVRFQGKKCIQKPQGFSVVSLRQLDLGKVKDTHYTLRDPESCCCGPHLSLSLCPVVKEIWAHVNDGTDPSRETMWRLKGGFFLFLLPGLLVCWKFTWPFISPLHKLLSFVQQLLFRRISWLCCLGQSSRMPSSGVYVRSSSWGDHLQSVDRIMW